MVTYENKLNHSWNAFSEFLKEVVCDAKVSSKVWQNIVVETMEGEYAKYSADQTVRKVLAWPIYIFMKIV